MVGDVTFLTRPRRRSLVYRSAINSSNAVGSGGCRRNHSATTQSQVGGYRVHFVGVAPSSPTAEQCTGNVRTQHGPFDTDDDRSLGYGRAPSSLTFLDTGGYDGDQLSIGRYHRNGVSVAGGNGTMPRRSISATVPSTGHNGTGFKKPLPQQQQQQEPAEPLPPPDGAWSVVVGCPDGLIMGSSTEMTPSPPVGHGAAVLPPPCVVGPSTTGAIRRTPYSPRYTSDGRLKHFPVGRAQSQRSATGSAPIATGSKEQLRRVDCPNADVGNAESGVCRLLQLHHHQQQQPQYLHHPHNHHHILPTGCNSPEATTKFQPNCGTVQAAAVLTQSEQ